MHARPNSIQYSQTSPKARMSTDTVRRHGRRFGGATIAPTQLTAVHDEHVWKAAAERGQRAIAAVKSTLLRLGLSALWYSGVARLLEPVTRGLGTIIMLHRVQPDFVHAPFAPNRGLSVTPEYIDALLAQLRRDAI